MNEKLLRLTERYKSDPESVYNTWFVGGEERMKAFRSIPECACKLYLVAPDKREKEVMAQLARPAFRNHLADIQLAYIPFNELSESCDALCRFGEDHTILEKIARRKEG